MLVQRLAVHSKWDMSKWGPWVQEPWLILLSKCPQKVQRSRVWAHLPDLTLSVSFLLYNIFPYFHILKPLHNYDCYYHKFLLLLNIINYYELLLPLLLITTVATIIYIYIILRSFIIISYHYLLLPLLLIITVNYYYLIIYYYYYHSYYSSLLIISEGLRRGRAEYHGLLCARRGAA